MNGSTTPPDQRARSIANLVQYFCSTLADPTREAAASSRGYSEDIFTFEAIMSSPTLISPRFSKLCRFEFRVPSTSLISLGLPLIVLIVTPNDSSISWSFFSNLGAFRPLDVLNLWEFYKSCESIWRRPRVSWAGAAHGFLSPAAKGYTKSYIPMVKR